MRTGRIKSLPGNFRPLLVILILLFSYAGYAQYNPAIAGTTSNKPYAPSSASPTDSRSYYYDAVNFTWRPYQSTAEVLFYLNLPKYRTGQFDIIVNAGGVLSGGLITGGINTVYYFKNGTADSNLVVKVSAAVDPSLFLLKASNLGDLPSIPSAKTNLGLNNVDNTSDATKWAASATLTNKTISGSNNTFLNIPNSALTNNSIGATTGTSGSDFNISGSPVPLGGSIIFNLPLSGPGVTGKLSGTDWTTFNSKQSAITLTTTGTSGPATFISNVLNIPQYSGGGSLGNADSIRHLFVDTGGTTIRNLYTIAFDSTNRKWVLTAPGSGSGTGIVSLNGLTAGTQTFAIGTSGTAPLFSSSGTVHTLNIPNALTSSVTGGLISNTDYVSFNSRARSVKTIANLYSYSTAGLNDSTVLIVSDTIAGGVFVYKASSTAPEDSGTIFKPTGGSGRWYRQYYGLKSVRFWGVNGDGVTNNTNRIQLAFNSCVGGALFFPSGIYMVDSLIWPAMLSIRGESRRNTRLQATAAGAQSFIRLGPGQSNEIYWIDLSLVANASNAGQNAFDFTAVPGSTTGGLWNFEMDRVDVTNFRGTGIKLECIDQSFDMAHQFLTFRQVRVFCTSDTSSHALIFKGQVNQTSFDDCEFDGPTPSVANTIGVLLISAVGSNDQIVGANSFHNLSVQGFDKAVFAFNAQGVTFNDDYFESDSVAIHATNSSRITVRDIHLSNVGNTRYVFGNDNSVLDVLGYRLTPNPIAGRFYTSPSGTPGGGVIQRGVGQTTNSITTVFVGQNVNVSGNALSTGYFTDIVTNVGLSKSNFVNTINSSLSSTEKISITANDQSHTGGFLWFKSASGNITLPANMDSSGLILRENQTATFLRSDILGTWRLVSVSQPEIYLSAYPTSGSWFTGEKVYNSTPTTTTAAFWVCKQGGQPGTWDSVVVGPGGGGGGGVSSVALALPASLFSVTGSPITSSGTLTGTLINQSAYTGFGNWTNSSAAPTFGKIPYQAFANGTANGLLGFDGSGNPTILQPDTLFFKNVGSSGLTYGWMSGDTIYHPNFKNGTGISITKGSDSAFTITSTALIDPLTTNGDILARISGSTTRLPQGSNGTFLGVSGGVLGYYTPAGGGSDSGIVAGYGVSVDRNTSSYRRVNIDTTNSFYLINPVLGLNNKIVSDGNSNSVGFNNGGLPSSYPRVSWRQLDSSVAGYQNVNLGVSGQTTQQMITNAPTVIDTAYNAAKTKNYLYAWEVENDAAINTSLSSLQLATNMNTYYTARNGVGWTTIGATGLPRTALSGTDSLLRARIDSANLALVNSHTSQYFIDFRWNPWLNNNRSRAGFTSDFIHMNPSGTISMADSFTNVVKRDQGQTIITPARTVSWGGNRPDRNMVIGPLNGFGVSLLANGTPVFDVTQFGKIAMIGTSVAEAASAPNIGFDLRPIFLNPNNFSSVVNADVRVNETGQWINSNNNGYKVIFHNGGVSGNANVGNVGYGIDVFANLSPIQNSVFFNSAFGFRALQASGIGSFNTMVGSFASDTHITSGNVIVNAGLTVGTIGANNTWVGAQGTISNSVANTVTIGYGNTTSVTRAINIGTANSLTGVSTNTGGSIIIGNNNTDAGFKAIIIANNEANNYGTAATADGQIILGDVYHAAGYKASDYLTLFGNQALNATIQAAFSKKTLTVAGIAGGGSNTNLAASANEFNIAGSVATGNALGGDITFATSVRGSSGTARESLLTFVRIGADQTFNVGEPASRPFYINTKATIGVNKDSIPHITSTAAMEVLVIDTTQGLNSQLKRITIPGGSSTNIYNTDGTLTANRTLSGATFTLSLGTSGSKLGSLSAWATAGVSFTGGQYASQPGSQLLEVASTINNPVTSASGNVTDFAAYYFAAPTITSTNTGVTYTTPATFRIGNAPTLGTNSSATGRVYALDVAAGMTHMGVGASNISIFTDGGAYFNGFSPNNAVGVGIGAGTSSVVSMNIAAGVDPTGGPLTATGNIWYNGTSLYFVDGTTTGVARDLLNAGVSLSETNVSTLTLSLTLTDYVFFGTTTTWTLPSLASSKNHKFSIKNAGSGNVTLQRAGSDNIYDTGSTTSITIAPGAAREIVAGTSFWYVL